MQSLLAQLDEELIHHLGKEEHVLFPYIAKLEAAQVSGGAHPEACFGRLTHPIAMMTSEHDAAGALLAEIRRLSDDFTTPVGACPTYHAFYDGLKEFEQDLHQHIHLENNILFPRAIAMEAAGSGRVGCVQSSGRSQVSRTRLNSSMNLPESAPSMRRWSKPRQ